MAKQKKEQSSEILPPVSEQDITIVEESIIVESEKEEGAPLEEPQVDITGEPEVGITEESKVESPAVHVVKIIQKSPSKVRVLYSDGRVEWVLKSDFKG